MPETEQGQKRIALVIGIGHYTHYHALQYAPPSAEDVYDLLIAPQFGNCDPQRSIKKVVKQGQTLTPAELDDIVNHTINHIETGDQFVFYFCGHGKIHGNDLFLILPESHKDAILECYDFRNIVRKLKLIGGNKALFIVDACHSAAMLNSIEELMDDWIPELPKGFGFMAASGKFQYAKQQPALERTIFSHYLCEGIKNWNDSRSPYITLPELKEYINKQITERHPETEQTAHILIQEGDHSIWVSLNPTYNKGSNSIDFKQKVKDVGRLLQKEEFTSAARESVITIEQALRQGYSQNQERVDETVRRNVQNALQKSKRGGIERLTMGQLVHLFRESGFLDALPQALGKDIDNIRVIALDELTKLRNKFMHIGREATRAEAEFLFNCLKVILETFDLIDFGYTEEKKTLEAGEISTPSEQKEREMNTDDFTIRRQEKIQKLLEEYDLLNEQVIKLRRAKIIETDPATLFKLEKQIEQAEEDLVKLEQEIETLKTSKQDNAPNQQAQKNQIHFYSEAKGVVIGDGSNITINFDK